MRNDLPGGFLPPGIFFRAKHSLGRGFFSMRDILPCGIFSCLCGAFPCAGFLPCGVPSVRGSFPCGAFSCAGPLPCGVLFRHPDWCDCRAGFRMLRASPSFPRPLSRALFPAPSFPSPLSRPLFPVPDTCRRARPDVPRVEPFPACLPAGGRCRALFSACCVRAVARAGPSFPRSVFDSLLKSPGPVLGIPPNFSYLWMQKMSFAALKTYRTE